MPIKPMTLICKWQEESNDEDCKLYCKAYPEHPECFYRPKDVITERICGKPEYYIERCSHFIATDDISILL
ncbi:Uncharacterised protein [uncultured archaeon]|nr:Uncharacterised protein [uncultured archaeon]